MKTDSPASIHDYGGSGHTQAFQENISFSVHDILSGKEGKKGKITEKFHISSRISQHLKEEK